jgi:UPF0755 protein
MAERPPLLSITPGPSQARRSRSRSRNRRRPPRGAYRRRRLIAGLLLLVIAFVVWFFISLFQPFHGNGSGVKKVIIPARASTSEVASLLSKDGVIGSSFFFKLRMSLDGDTGKLRAGVYRMPLGTTYANALHILTTAPAVPPSENVTIIPGRSRQQLNKILRSQGVNGYLQRTRHSRLLNPTHYGAPKDTPSLEGFLFPDTYQLVKPITAKALIAAQLKQFKVEFAKVNLKYAKSKNLTPYDVLKIASLISEESAKPADGPKVASVIYNRLREDMDLGLDSTVSYATGDYSGDLTEKELHSPSPWNTTNHRGLPPTPIDSPSLADMQAAAHPKNTDYLYFINKVCGNGKLAFTSSYTTFEQLSAAYSAASARAAKDGGSPEYCKKKK